MAAREFQSDNLRAGEFYGQVPQKKMTGASILTELIQRQVTRVPPHHHELAFFQFLLEGAYRETLGSKTLSLSPMTILWHPPGRIHQDEIGADGVRFLMIEIQPDYTRKLEDFIKIPDDFYIKSGPLSWLAFRQYYELNNWGPGSDLIVEGLTLEMLGQFVKRQTLTEKKAPGWLVRIVEKLNDQFTLNFTTEELAAEANVHQVHLAAVFRRHYHETVGEYVQRLRVKHAAKLLFDRKLSLVEIAYLSGFSDQSHFTRTFKRLVGVTPGNFRNSLK